MTSMRREKQGHVQRRVTEAEFRRKASAKDGEKLVQYESESTDERCKKRKKRKIVTYSTSINDETNCGPLLEITF